jgi:hypothetical protein
MGAMTTASAQQKLPVRRLTCARCGAAFDCGTGGKDGGCWCMDETVRLPMPESGGGDCLCPACLGAPSAAGERKIC